MLLVCLIIACNTQPSEKTAKESPLIGSWKLLKGTTIENGDTVITDYTNNTSFIKIINNTHFSFLNHDLQKGKDTSNAVFVAGGGTYTFKDSTYTERLEYCSAREWEGIDFSFTVTFNGDTLTQQGLEQVKSAGVNRINIEQYVRIK